MADRNPPKTVVVGHPYIPQGMGEHIRSSYRAFQAAGLNLPLRDVFGYAAKTTFNRLPQDATRVLTG